MTYISNLRKIGQKLRSLSKAIGTHLDRLTLQVILYLSNGINCIGHTMMLPFLLLASSSQPAVVLQSARQAHHQSLHRCCRSKWKIFALHQTNVRVIRSVLLKPYVWLLHRSCRTFMLLAIWVLVTAAQPQWITTKLTMYNRCISRVRVSVNDLIMSSDITNSSQQSVSWLNSADAANKQNISSHQSCTNLHVYIISSHSNVTMLRLRSAFKFLVPFVTTITFQSLLSYRLSWYQ